MPSSKSRPTPKSSSPRPVHQWQFEAIGTQWWIGLYETVDQHKLSRLQAAISSRIDEFDATWSRFKEDSWVNQLSKSAGIYSLPADAAPMLGYYRQLYELTAGKMTPLVGQLLADAGYNAEYSFNPSQLRAVPDWDEVMSISESSVEITMPLMLDVGAAGKGYLVDIIAALLRTAGINSFLVDASGDMYAAGLAAPLKIGLENPDDAQQVIGVAELAAGALCASSPNRRQWGEHHHIMDPQKLASPQHIKAVWVMAATAMVADGLATALFFTSAQQLRSRLEFEYAILYADGRLERSSGLPATIFTA